MSELFEAYTGLVGLVFTAFIITVFVYLSKGPGPSQALYDVEVLFTVLSFTSGFVGYLCIRLSACLMQLSCESAAVRELTKLVSYIGCSIASVILVAQCYQISRQGPFVAPERNATAMGNSTAPPGAPAGWPTSEGIEMASTLYTFGLVVICFGALGYCYLGLGCLCIACSAAAEAREDAKLTSTRRERQERASGGSHGRTALEEVAVETIDVPRKDGPGAKASASASSGKEAEPVTGAAWDPFKEPPAAAEGREMPPP
jgi:hypothetical protein